MITLILAGAVIGLIVGLTGVGGGSLMTPFLLWYGIPAHVAVGTDLLFAAITKSSGIVAHSRQNHVRWRAVLALGATSIPASLITLYLLQNHFPNADEYAPLMKLSLGLMLCATGVILFLKVFFGQPFAKTIDGSTDLPKNAFFKLLLVGAPLGVVVTLSSVGAGVIGTMLLMVILPNLRSQDIVGTDLAHAVPLTFVAGMGHYLMLGNLDFQLLIALLLGSLPAVYLGGVLSQRVPDQILRLGLAVCLVLIGGYYTLTYF